MNSNDTNQDFVQMTEPEIKSHKKVFSRLSLSLLAFLGVVEILVFIAVYIIGKLAPSLLYSNNFSLILSSVLQYCIGFPIMYLIIRKMPRQKPSAQKLGAIRILQYMLVGILIMYIGNSVSQFLMTKVESFLGHEVENDVSSLLSGSNFILSIIFVGIIGPIVEELMFRKLLIDRLTPYGNVIAIIFPSLLFGLFHGNLYQFFYAFALGIIFSYIYIKTGKILYSTLLHTFINLFCGVLPAAIMSMLDMNAFNEALAQGTGAYYAFVAKNILPFILMIIYEIAMFAMLIAGLVILIRNFKKIRLEKGSVRFPKGRSGEVIFFNAGTIAFIAVFLIIIAMETFAA